MKQILMHQKLQKRRRSDALSFLRYPGYRRRFVLGSAVVIVIALLSTTAFDPANNTSADPLDIANRTPQVILAAGFFPVLEGTEIGISTAESDATGSGALRIDRNEDFDHVISSGETLSEIAYVYQIDTLKLAAYNYITNIHTIRVGDVIRIPSIAKEMQIAYQDNVARVRTTTSIPAAASAGNIPRLVIGANEQYDGQAVTAHFFIQAPKDVQLKAFEWDLGNGHKSFRPEVFWSYDSPGTYRVTLTARLEDNRSIVSNEILLDVPHPTTFRAEYQSFITLSSVHEQFALQGKLLAVLNYRNLESAPIEVISSNFDTTIYRFTRSGYFNLSIEHDDVRSSVYVFVSPMESVHVERSDLNWYRTQFNTGSQSNCGPSTVSMAIAWARGDYVPVSTIRQQVGWQEERLGATSYEELYDSLLKNDINARFRRLYSKDDLFSVIDQGNIAIVLFETGDIPWAEGHPIQSTFGRYYTYTQGHYIIIKGYSADRKYFIAYDPIPSDWGSNSLRYADGISMIGRNRYYPADTMLQSMRKKRSQFLEIWQ